MSTVHDQEIVDWLRDIVASVLELSQGEVWPAALFYEDLAAGSLEQVEIAVQIERRAGVHFTTEEAAQLRSVADAAALLRAKGVARPLAPGGC